jgi:NMD protein affecting ribosome stability and mRNA decay
MTITIGTTPALAADAYVRGEKRRCIGIDEFRGSWLVIALGARVFDMLELAALDDAFNADGAVVVAATAHDYEDVAARLETESVRFPVFTDVEESRRVTLILDPQGVIRHVGLRRSARETLGALELTQSAQRALCPSCGREHDLADAA